MVYWTGEEVADTYGEQRSEHDVPVGDDMPAAREENVSLSERVGVSGPELWMNETQFQRYLRLN